MITPQMYNKISINPFLSRLIQKKSDEIEKIPFSLRSGRKKLFIMQADKLSGGERQQPGIINVHVTKIGATDIG
jgi:hypothetical protein